MLHDVIICIMRLFCRDGSDGDCCRIVVLVRSKLTKVRHFQVPVSSWFDDVNDRELQELIPFLESISQAESVYGMLQAKFKGGVGVGGGGSNSLANSNGQDKSSSS